MRFLKPALLVLLCLTVAAALFIFILPEPAPLNAGTIAGKKPNYELVAHREKSESDAASALSGTPATKQILFGDLHVHSAFSTDAFAWSLPSLQGEGLHPPAEACDYARYCSALDFWSITDHAEGITPELWAMQKQNIRDCNAIAGDTNTPDVVAFLGWEWTQMSLDPNKHYGHKNVILRHTDDDRIPARPIASKGVATDNMRKMPPTFLQKYIYPLGDLSNRDLYVGLNKKRDDIRNVPACAENVPSPDLPNDCFESVAEPKDLFRKLDEWNTEALVIPHGNTWGFTSPPSIGWDKQLKGINHDDTRQNLVEIFSGHGNAEEYRQGQHIAYDANGNRSCPLNQAGFTACCERAGEIIRQRCENPASAECDSKVADARQNYVDAGRFGHLTLSEVNAEDWASCGQCTDCYMPAFSPRYKTSSQYALAISNFDELNEDGQPRRFRFGFIGSSDNHNAQPGTGYKELGRHNATDVFGPKDKQVKNTFFENNRVKGDPRASYPFDATKPGLNFLQISESERQGSYFYTGGLVAVHAEGRHRDAIWNALKRKEVYATSGERHLLWFDLLNTNSPMGSEAAIAETPKFRVRAIGAFEQAPGCPDVSKNQLGEKRLQRLCGGECFNPTGTRQLIDRIEVVRIRPQTSRGEPVENLIEDPWKTFQCTAEEAGCSVEFDDPDFIGSKRENIYYVRALTQPRPTINGDPLRCEFDADGQCKEVRLCMPGFQTDKQDDCLTATAERAWSSPIFVTPRS